MVRASGDVGGVVTSVRACGRHDDPTTVCGRPVDALTLNRFGRCAFCAGLFFDTEYVSEVWADDGPVVTMHVRCADLLLGDDG